LERRWRGHSWCIKTLWRKGMYIGLGGILVLILILWLLGVI
jgi:hypothetical protein